MKLARDLANVVVLTSWVLAGGCAAAAAPGSPPGPSSDGYFAADDGVWLYYRTIGAHADTIVVVHGNPGHHMNYLLPDLLPLARGRTLLFYDQRGGGRSQPVADMAALAHDRQISDVEALRRHFRMERLALLAHSGGAVLAASYAARHPQRVARMMLVAAPPPAPDAYRAQTMERFLPRLDSAAYAHLLALDRSLATSPDPAAVCLDIMRAMLVAPVYFATEAGARRFRGDFCDAPDEALRTSARRRDVIGRSRAELDLSADLPHITAPVLVVHGEEDAIPLDAARQWARHLGDARLLVIPGADHYPHAERPKRFFPAAERFFDGRWPRAAEQIPWSTCRRR
jgi:proline iminopeptidase